MTIRFPVPQDARYAFRPINPDVPPDLLERYRHPDSIPFMSSDGRAWSDDILCQHLGAGHHQPATPYRRDPGRQRGIAAGAHENRHDRYRPSRVPWQYLSVLPHGRAECATSPQPLGPCPWSPPGSFTRRGMASHRARRSGKTVHASEDRLEWSEPCTR
jgi:hypothetical protein